MTSYIILESAARDLKDELEDSLNNQWHTGAEWDRLVYRINRLVKFLRFLELRREFCD